MAVRISAAWGRPNLIRLPRSHWQGIRLVRTAPKTTAKPLAHRRLSFLFNRCTRRTQSLKCCMPTRQQTTTHTYQFWKLTGVPCLYFRGMHAQPVPHEVDISTTQLPHSSSNLSGLPKDLGTPTSAVTPAKAPHIQKAWTNGQSAARQQMTQEQRSWQIHQLEEQSAQPAKELTCILIPSWHCQHGNKWHFFRVSSKHLLSQTNDFFLIANENNFKKKSNLRLP